MLVIERSKPNTEVKTAVPASAAQHLQHEQRALRAYELRYVEGKRLNQVAADLGVAATTAGELAQAGARLLVQESDRAKAKEAALAELEALRAQAYEWMRGQYSLVQFGKIARDAEGEALLDIGPNLQAMDRLLRIEKRLAEIFGYNAPRRAAVQVLTEDAWLAAIRELEEQLGLEPGEDPPEAAELIRAREETSPSTKGP